MVKIPRMILFLLFLSSTVFAHQDFNKINDEITFDAAHLNGHFTRNNMEKYNTLHFSNPNDCSLAVIAIGKKGTSHIPADQFMIPKIDISLPTKEILDLMGNDPTLGDFMSFENDFSYPIPECAYNVKFTFDNQTNTKPFMGIFKVNRPQ